MKLSFPTFAAAFLVSQGHAARPVPPFHLDAAVESDSSAQKGSEVKQLRVEASQNRKGRGRNPFGRRPGRQNASKKSSRKGNRGGNRNDNSDNSDTPADIPADLGFSAVYAMTNQPAPAGNSILVYPRNPDDGTLSFAGSFPTGGNGFGQRGTAPGDPLASQDPIKVVNNCLLAVNAGSETLSSFTIDSASSITLASQVPTGGEIPVSLTNWDNRVYVLNAGGNFGVGSFKGFTLEDDCRLTELTAITVLTQQYEVSPVNPPAGISAASEINVTPEGNLLVLIKVEGGGDMFVPGQSGVSSLNHYRLQDNGKPFQRSLVKTIIEDRPGSAPFAFDFDNQGRLLLVEAVTNTVSEWEINDDYTYTQVNEVNTQQAASCWIRFNPGNECFYTSNSVGGSISSLGAAPGSDHELIESVAAGGIPGPIDLISSADGQNMYVLSPDVGGDEGPGIYVYSAADNCGLTQLPTVRDGFDMSFLDETGVAGVAIYPAN